MVLPDNVLFEGGAGETVRRELLKQADVHTLAAPAHRHLLRARREGQRPVLRPQTRRRRSRGRRSSGSTTCAPTSTSRSRKTPLKRSDLDDFVACYNPKNRHERKESERFKSFTYEELIKRDKLNLDIFWLKDESLEDSANLPAPDVIAAEIVEDLEAALEQFAEIAADLKK